MLQMEMTDRERRLYQDRIHLQVKVTNKGPKFVHNFLRSVTDGKCPSLSLAGCRVVDRSGVGGGYGVWKWRESCRGGNLMEHRFGRLLIVMIRILQDIHMILFDIRINMGH